MLCTYKFHEEKVKWEGTGGEGGDRKTYMRGERKRRGEKDKDEEDLNRGGKKDGYER